MLKKTENRNRSKPGARLLWVIPAVILMLAEVASAQTQPTPFWKVTSMDAMTAIRTRRSIRKFSPHPVSPELVKEILAAGMSAPSANNEQPWQFVVITDQKILAQVGRINPHAAFAQSAPVSILVCGDLTNLKYEGYWVQDCSAGVQNMLLAAHASGLGAVWTGIYPKSDRVAGFKKLVQLPDRVIPLALIVIGYPAEKVPPSDRYREERVHHETW